MAPTDPTSLHPLPVEAWDPSLADIVRDMNGAPLEVHKLMAHNPRLLEAWWDFRNHSVGGGTLGERLGELVILRVGVQLEAWYEWASHVDRALRCGLTAEEIDRVLVRDVRSAGSTEDAGNTGDGWPAPEAALLEAVDELVETRALSAPMRARLAEHFSAAQVLDIIAIHGMYVILGCMIRSWGLALDPAVDARIGARIGAHATPERFAEAARRFHDAGRHGTGADGKGADGAGDDRRDG